jgi:parvulin-like peptidyl-prolyl isomerase
MKQNQNPLDSIRSRIGGRSNPAGSSPRRSRRDQEARYHRLFMLSMIGVAALIILILGGGAVYEYVIKPNAVLAEVNGHEIRRKDYWKYQSVALYNQARQYESFAVQTTGDQQQQFLQFAASFDAQREDVWGSTDVSATTIQQMIDDQLYLDGAESLGVTVTDADVQQYALNQFTSADAPLITPQPSPTMIPERAQSATETADALATQQSIALGTPVAPPVASPVVATPGSGTPGATPVVDAEATPVTDGTATPATPAAATPNPEDTLRAAEAEYDIFQSNVFETAHMSEEDYLRLWVKPQMVRTQVNYQLTSQLPQTAEQVNAAHILVGTEDLANQLYEQATGGASFEALAKANSTDTATSLTGGLLGWFTRLEVDSTLADQAFALEPGQISQPFQTGYGWQLVKVIDKQADRPMTDAQYQLANDDAIETWIEQQRSEADISSDYETTPTPTPATFAPPAGAPTPIPATPIPTTPTPEPPIIGPQPVVPGTPGASPVADGAGTPIASPAMAPGATPAASPAATPPASGTPVG